MEYQIPQDDMDVIRMKDIINQFTDVIFLLCAARKTDAYVVLSQFTNLSDTEYNNLHINFNSKGM